MYIPMSCQFLWFIGFTYIYHININHPCRYIYQSHGSVMGHVMSICFFLFRHFLSTKTHLPTLKPSKVVASGEGDTGSSVQVRWVAGWWMVVRVDSRYGKGCACRHMYLPWGSPRETFIFRGYNIYNIYFTQNFGGVFFFIFPWVVGRVDGWLILNGELLGSNLHVIKLINVLNC